MCVTIPCRGITSRRLAALLTSLCPSKEVGITWLAWYVSLCTTHLVGDALACSLGFIILLVRAITVLLFLMFVNSHLFQFRFGRLTLLLRVERHVPRILSV